MVQIHSKVFQEFYAAASASASGSTAWMDGRFGVP